MLFRSKLTAAVVSLEPEERLKGRDSSPLQQERKLIPISVRGLVEDRLRDYFRFTSFISAGGITFIAAIDQDSTQTGLIDLLADACKEVQRILGITVTIGVGYSTQRPERIGESYQSAVDALGYKAIVGTGGTIYINDMEPVSRGKLQLNPKDETELENRIKFGTPETIGEAVREIAGRMEDTRAHASQYQVYRFSLINCIMRLMQQYDMDLRQIFDAEGDVIRLMGSGHGREEFPVWLTRVACRMNEFINRRRDNTARQVIEEAKQYIQDHYQEPDLSVEMVCRQLHMSPAYFSTIFRKIGRAHV